MLQPEKSKVNRTIQTTMYRYTNTVYIKGKYGFLTKIYEEKRHRNNYGCDTLLVYQN